MSGTKIYLFLIGVFSIVSLLSYSPALAEDAPTGIAGIVLGSDVKTYPALTQSNFLKDVVITDWHGFRKGVISYGACKHVDQILKIDLKYKQKSKVFYTELLKKFQAKFGEPDIWKGDAFGVVYTWKWYFTDTNKNRVSLILQHNSKNSNETIGNIVKLSYPDKITEERLCFAQMCQTNNNNISEDIQEERKKSDWSYLIPR